MNVSCPICTFKNKLDAKFCEICGNSIIASSTENSEIECKLCTYKNTLGKSECEICKESLFVANRCSFCSFENIPEATNCQVCKEFILQSNAPLRTTVRTDTQRNSGNGGPHSRVCPRCTVILSDNDILPCQVCGYSSKKNGLASDRDCQLCGQRGHIAKDCSHDNDANSTDLRNESTLESSSPNNFSSSSCTTGIIELLEAALSRPAVVKNVFHLCSPCPHITQRGAEGADWSCGYRNIQMLCLSLMSRPEYRAVLFGGNGIVPDVNGLQAWLERAWNAGFDVDGMVQLGGAVLGTDTWIGATECVALLRFMGVRAHVVDFSGLRRAPERGSDLGLGGCGVNSIGTVSRPRKKKKARPWDWNEIGDDDDDEDDEEEEELVPRRKPRFTVTHEELVAWVRCYFQWRWPKGNAAPVPTQHTTVLPSTDSIDAPDAANSFLGDDRVSSDRQTGAVAEVDVSTGAAQQPRDSAGGQDRGYLPPLYFQHQGHSRTVVGVEEKNDKVSLLLFDPNALGRTLKSHLTNESSSRWQAMVKRGIHTLRQANYQIVYISPGIMSETERENSKIISSESIDCFSSRIRADTGFKSSSVL